MLSHYLTIALRSFRRQKLHTALAITSLGLGLGCFVAGYVFVTYVENSESQFTNAPRIYAIYQGRRSPSGAETPLAPMSAPALAAQLAIDFPQLSAVARSAPAGGLVAAGDKRFVFGARAVDYEFLDIFDLRFVAGNRENALRHGTAVGTVSAALLLFGTRDVVGRTIRVGDRIDLTIAGIVEDPRPPSHLAGGFLGNSIQWFVPMHVYEELYPTMARNPPWSTGAGMHTYVLLPADGSLTAAELNEGLATFGERHVPKDFGAVEFEGRHVSRIAIDFYQAVRFQRTAGIVSVQAMLLGLGALALGAAVLNFVNLATAQTARRAREIGVRKVLGATPKRVALQHLVETFVAVIAAFALAVVLVAGAAWLLRQQSIAIDFAALPVAQLAVFGVVLAAGVTLLAGVYPALVLARARAMHALVTGSLRGGSRLLRTALVGSQFAAAGLLLLAVIVMYGQGSALERRALPRTDDAFLTIFASFGQAGVSFDTFAAELERSPNVVGVTGTGMPPWSVAPGARGTTMSRSQDAAVEAVTVESRFVGYDYFETLEMELLAGRFFSRDRPDDRPAAAEPGAPPGAAGPSRMILDRTAAERLGWTDPRDAVGQLVYSGANLDRQHEIIGVTEGLPLTIDANSDAFVYQLAPGVASGVIVRLARDSVAAGVADVQAVWERLSPNVPLNRSFLDEGFRGAYSTYASMNRLFVGLAAFVLFIASAGLFGIASYSVRTRLREIGVRKIFGASRSRILRLMLWDFAKPVVAANVIVWPLGFIAMQAYLSMFTQRMPLTPLPFILSMTLAVAIAWVAAGVHVAAATRVEPARVLRHE